MDLTALIKRLDPMIEFKHFILFYFVRRRNAFIRATTDLFYRDEYTIYTYSIYLYLAMTKINH